MAISKEDIKKVANLAKLDLNDIEIDNYQQQLGKILEYIDILKEVEVSDLEFLGLGDEDVNQVRLDEASSWPQDEIDIALEQVIDKEEHQVKINRIL
ncbi:MAG TPA: Asp-tRNA(Asn)/Glu-tRNA(Gln) amidotransferase subunit GatC [bacterium]|nr:Asp-tRNA(Asn)/Glu-tRNA(Gln) amidotransferase subunit GatC [bacterium]